MIEGIHHIAILLSSEKTLDFYKLLGFTESFRKERKNDSVILLDGYGIQLEVFIDDRHPTHPTGLNEPLGIRHFALQVDDVYEEMQRLKNIFREQMDCEIIFENVNNDWVGEKYVFFKDPDGNVIELHQISGVR